MSMARLHSLERLLIMAECCLAFREGQNRDLELTNARFIGCILRILYGEDLALSLLTAFKKMQRNHKPRSRKRSDLLPAALTVEALVTSRTGYSHPLTAVISWQKSFNVAVVLGVMSNTLTSLTHQPARLIFCARLNMGIISTRAMLGPLIGRSNHWQRVLI